MADQKLTQLAAEATPTDDDIMYIVDDPAGVPTSKKIPLSTLFNPLPGILTLANAGLHLLDTNASHDLIISPGSDLAADRTLTLTTGDAARTVTLSGSPTLSDWFDQSVKQAASPTFADCYVTDGGMYGIAGNKLLTFNAAGNATFSGVDSVVVPDGAWVGADANAAWLFNTTSSFVTCQDYVGIRRTVPLAALHVQNTTSGLQLLMERDNGGVGDYAGMRFKVASADTDIYAKAGIFFQRTAAGNAYGEGDLLFCVDTAADTANVEIADVVMTLHRGGNVAIGLATAAAKCHIDQPSDAGAIPVLALDQADMSEGFINFIGSVDDASCIRTDALGTYYGRAMIEVNGTTKWLALYNT